MEVLSDQVGQGRDRLEKLINSSVFSYLLQLEKRTKNDDMSYSNIFEWSCLLVYEDFIQFVQRIETFDNVAKNCMFAIQVIDVVG